MRGPAASPRIGTWARASSWIFRISPGACRFSCTPRKSARRASHLSSNSTSGTGSGWRGGFITKTGEPTIRVKTFTVLSKSLRPLPDKWHGVQDAEIEIPPAVPRPHRE